ncbi:MAG: hypothetical protein Q4D02_05255 [Clostridia bacterium]|nr:hypothetical protein [Clostridia bacterium]
MAEKVYINVSKKNGNYVEDLARDLFSEYTDEQMATIIKHVDGHDVVECIATNDGNGNMICIAVPIPA